jgi:hypothetical protein
MEGQAELVPVCGAAHKFVANKRSVIAGRQVEPGMRQGVRARRVARVTLYQSGAGRRYPLADAVPCGLGNYPGTKARMPVLYPVQGVTQSIGI